jgi:DNA-directed RNA polymerase subunit L
MITGPKPNVLLPDRDTGDAIHFLDMKENASLHIKASLSLARPKASSQVCVSTFQNHVIKREKGDTTSKKYQVEVDRELYIENGGDPRVFDAILWQRSFEKNEQGRAYWFDFAAESVGVMTGKEIVRSAIDILKKGIDDFCKTDPQPEDEEGWYTMTYENDTFTIGQLVQEIMYTNSQVGFVSRDVGHPLVPKLTIRFSTASDPVAVRESFRTEAVALCEKILSSV